MGYRGADTCRAELFLLVVRGGKEGRVMIASVHLIRNKATNAFNSKCCAVAGSVAGGSGEQALRMAGSSLQG